MKKVLFSLSGIAALVALIICFQNIAITTQVGLFFSQTSRNLFGPLALLFVLGAAAGFFLALALKAKEDRPRDIGGEF